MDYEFHITRKQFNGPYHVVWRGADPSESEWLDWSDGDLFTNHPTGAMIDKMVRIATALGTTVQGDEGEVYKSATDWSTPSE